MNKIKSHSLIILGIVLIAIGIGVYHLFVKEAYHAGPSSRVHDSSKRGSPFTEPELQLKNDKQPNQVNTLSKHPNRSKVEWTTWIIETAHFRIERGARWEDALFQFDSAAFKEADLPGLGNLTSGLIHEWMHDMYPMSGKSRLESEGRATMVPECMPTVVASTSNSTTFVFPKRMPPEPADRASRENIINYYENRGKALSERIKFSLKYNNYTEAERSLGPEYAESVAEWCMSQPVLRRFGNTELSVTFEDIEVDGKQVFQVTETMPGLDGSPPVINQFTSPEMPAPYNRLLLTK